ncbi:MAG: TonB-dependent receptor plug domain-containing protein [Bacteroidota bacterium]
MNRIRKTRVWGLCFCFVILSVQSFAQAKSTTLAQGTYKTIYEMLRDVPGLEVKTSNDKSGGSVVVRGISSLNNQKPPLFVVDGAIYSGDITNINAQDVDMISVLKDAASTAAYGAQGVFGVIVITTKKGQGVTSQASVTTHTESAYAYFIEHKTPLKVFGHDDAVIIEGVIARQKDSSLVFMKRKNEVLVAIKDIKRVEMIRY